METPCVFLMCRKEGPALLSPTYVGGTGNLEASARMVLRKGFSINGMWPVASEAQAKSIAGAVRAALQGKSKRNGWFFAEPAEVALAVCEAILEAHYNPERVPDSGIDKAMASIERLTPKGPLQ